jgi:hypothetical protein
MTTDLIRRLKIAADRMDELDIGQFTEQRRAVIVALLREAAEALAKAEKDSQEM